MRVIESNPSDFNIYCTSADSINHSFFTLSTDELLRQIKLCSIIGEHVYISVSHIYENPQTAKLLFNNPELLNSGIVAIGLRGDCRDFSDYIEQREGIDGKDVCENDRKITKFLNSNTENIITWLPSDQQSYFKSAIYEVLNNPKSALRKSLTATKKEDIEKLTKAIYDMPENKATRTNIANLALNFIPSRIRAFMREVNLLYYFIGSKDKFLVPHLDPNLFTNLKEGYKKSIDSSLTGKPIDNWLKETLRHSYVPLEILESLTIQQIASFRQENRISVKRFRKKWWSVSEYDQEFYDFDGLKGESYALKQLLEELRKEKLKMNKYNKIIKSVEVSSLAFSVLSLIPNPTLAVLSLLFTVGCKSIENDRVKHRLLYTDFLALSSSLRSYLQDKELRRI